jgi:hypothetical protein
LALREAPVDEVLELARPFFAELGEALEGRRVVLVAGNHDHQLAHPLLERRRVEGTSGDLGLESAFKSNEAPLLASIARWMSGVEVVGAYPGLWVRPDVYATHGHYLDCHMTVPRLESLYAAIVRGLIGELPEEALGPQHYEALLAPIYAFAYSRAQAGAAQMGTAARSVRAARRLKAYGWEGLMGDGGRSRLPARLVAGVALGSLVAALNRAGLGRFRLDLSSAERGRAGLRAMGDVVDRLGLSAQYVIFGHTHHAGPLDGAEWTAGGATRLFNTGSWVYDPALIAGAGERSPYWPGTAVFVEDSGPPRLRRLLSDNPLASAAA